MSMPTYPEYKQSDVGWSPSVPSDWSVLPVKRGFTRKKELNNGMKCENRLSLTMNGVLRRSLDDLDGLQASEFESYQIFENQDLVFKLIDLQNVKTSRVGIVHEKGIMSPAYIRLVPNTNCVYPKFAYWYFTDLYLREIFNQLGAGVRQTLGSEDLLVLPFFFPSYEEQKIISKFLDTETRKIEQLISEQQELIQLLNEKCKVVISHAVTKGLDLNVITKSSGNLWLGDVPNHWKVGKVKHIKSDKKNSFVDGPFGSNLKSEHFIDNGDVYVIESNFATQGRLNLSELKTISFEHFETISRSEVCKDDIVIAKIGAQYGKSSVLPEIDKRAVVSGNSLKLTVNTSICDTQFVNWFLTNLKSLGVIEDIVNATAQPALSLGDMNNLPMLIPSLAEQRQITSFLSKRTSEFQSLIQEAQKSIDLLLERKSALISAAVTGKIDVRNVALDLESA